MRIVFLNLIVVFILQVAVLTVMAEESSYTNLESEYGLLFDDYEPNLPIPNEEESQTTLTSYDPRITNSVTI